MEEKPKLYHGIMVSSTFTDLEAHRSEVVDAIARFGFRPNVMEYSGARSDADVIDISLEMVRDSAAYLCVLGHKYGQTPVDPDRNPKGLSITELEFNEARRLGRPILLFLMSDEHSVTPGDVELDAKKRRKLDAFRKQAKRIDPGAAAERVYETFASKDEFAKQAAIAVGLQAIRMAGGSQIPDRAIRDAIARFIDVKPEANQAELTEAIERFEAGYRALEQQVAAIPVNDNRVTALKSDAEAALAEGDLDKARAAYREAAEAARDKAVEPVRIAAELKAAEAGAHLLALDWEGADAAWAEATAILVPFDPVAAEDLADDAGTRLSLHGELYAIAGALSAAINRWRDLAALAEARGDGREAALFRDKLGIALLIQGRRASGADGRRLLDEAAAAFRSALSVDDEPESWAATQNNLGNVLTAQGERSRGSERVRMYKEAITAFKNALTAYPRSESEASWAVTQNNLGNALMRQGQITADAQGVRLLDEAVNAFREALKVHTRADLPAKWGMTQNNLGNALASQAVRTDGPEGLRLLEKAVGAFQGALTVRTRSDMPALWATTHENIGLVLEMMVIADPESARAYLVAAEAAFLNALEIYTPEHMAYYHNKATASLTRIREQLAELDS